jgi:BirA family biotin operon repressor/biotin-[acetyl-CoA-carboxylase] ligase
MTIVSHRTPPELLLPEAIEPLIQDTIFHGQIRHHLSVASTNALAMQAGQAGEAEGAVFFAEEQTAGRGRGGHDWHSAPATGVYVSLLLRPQMAPADVLTLTLLAGLATVAAIDETTKLKADLRWPNDLLLSRAAYTAEGSCVREERKVCGILTELNAEVTRVRFVVVGIGINVNQAEFPPELGEIATSLRLESGRAWSRVQLAAALLQSFDREYRRFAQPEGRNALLRRFEEASSFARGRRVHVAEEGGYTGTTEGLDARGFLQLRGEDGKLRTVLSGTVRGI